MESPKSRIVVPSVTGESREPCADVSTAVGDGLVLKENGEFLSARFCWLQFYNLCSFLFLFKILFRI